MALQLHKGVDEKKVIICLCNWGNPMDSNSWGGLKVTFDEIK
jgi:hypothetical protein